MNKRPIEQARDADLRLTHAALRRAALRARELAAQTGTELIVCREGVIARIKPYPGNNRNEVQEIPTQYEDAP